MRGLTQTWKVALRKLGRDPGFTISVLLSLSLGIGATTTIFSLVDALFIRPLPGVVNPRNLVSLTPRPVQVPGLPGASFHAPLAYPTFQAYLEGARASLELAVHQPVVVHAVAGDRVQRLDAELVSPNYFSLLGVSAAAGRLVLADSGKPAGRPDVVVLGYSLWKAWGGDRGLLGRVIRLDGAPLTVLGVAHKGFHGTQVDAKPQLWIPLAAAPRLVPGMDEKALRDPEHGWLFWFVGRLRPGVGPQAAQEHVNAVAAGLGARGFGDEQAAGLIVTPGIGLHPAERKSASTALKMLMAAVVFLLLIACLNTSILLLSRLPRQRAEMSLRLALGARRTDLVGELLIESLVLGLGGALGGFLGAFLGARLLSQLDWAGFLPTVERIGMDLRVLGFALGAGILSVIVFGLVPALRASRVELAAALKRYGSGGPIGDRLQRLAVVVELTLSVTLLVGTGLLTRSLVNYQSVPLGFKPEKVFDVRFDLERQGYSQAAGRAFLKRVLERARAMPGVESASLASAVPLTHGAGRDVAQVAPESGGGAGEAAAWVGYDCVGPGYLPTLGIRLIRGRGFSDRDDRGAPGVALVNQTFATRFWPNEDPLGQWLSFGDRRVRVVGVTVDTRTDSLTKPVEPHFYLPLFQEYRPVVTLHTRSGLDAAAVLPQMVRLVHELDPHIPLFAEGRLSQQIEVSFAKPRLAVGFVGLAAFLGLLLSLIGVGGVMYKTAVARLRETGIRMAMGASRFELIWLFLRRGLATAAVGLLLGGAGALALSRALASFLFGVSPDDLYVLVTVLGAMAGLAVLANGLPAYVGTRVDPAQLLREE